MRGLVMIEPRLTYAHVLTRLCQLLRNDHLVLSILAIVVGAVVGISIGGFRAAIDLFQGVFYGLDSIYGNESEHLVPIASKVPGWRIVLATTLGGLVVGILVSQFLLRRRPQGIAEVIQANALLGGRMSSRVGAMG